MQFNQTYVPQEASLISNKDMEQIHYNQVLPQKYTPFTDCPVAWETLLQSESEQMQLNQAYVPDKALAQVITPMVQIHGNEAVLQNFSAIPDCPAGSETLLNKESFEMQFNQTYAPEKALVQVNTPMENLHCNQVMLQNFSAIPDCPLKRESVEKFHQENEKTMNNLNSRRHGGLGMALTIRRERNRERERKRQTRLKGGFNMLRSVIPDYFSGREPGDRLSKIQTLRLAMEYIATLKELLKTS